MRPVERRPLTASEAERFWAKVDKSGECWMWTGCVSRGGYGSFSVTSADNRLAHRVAYELTIGAIPPGLLACHKCDVCGCVNPAHIFLGTSTDNNRDRESKGRGRKQRGEANTSATLTWEKVREIRALRSSGFSQVDLARTFGVSKQSITNIIQGRTWLIDGYCAPPKNYRSSAVLRWEDAVNIRDLAARGFSRDDLAKRYGTTSTSIGRIIRGDRWKTETGAKCRAF